MTVAWSNPEKGSREPERISAVDLMTVILFPWIEYDPEREAE